MKLRKISVMLILAICLSLVPISVFASSEAVSLNDLPSVKQGGSVTVSGTTTLEEVIVQVLRPNKTSTLYYDITTPADGQFSITFTMPSSEAVGTYKVVAGQGNQVSEKDLVVTQADAIITPTDPIIPIITVPAGPAGPAEPVGPAGNPVTPIGTDAEVVPVDTSNNIVSQTTGANGQVVNTVAQDADALAAALAKAAAQDNRGAAPIVAIPFSNPTGEGVVFNLPASVLNTAAGTAPNTIISLQTNDGEYSLPINIINYAAIAQSLGTTIDNLNIQVHISTGNSDLNAKIRKNAQDIGASQLGSAIEFSIHATGNGKSIEINGFGSTYVARTIILSLSSSVNSTTVVVYDPATGKFSFVPATFTKDAGDKIKVTFKRNGNSIYTVLSSEKTFTDIHNHWAKADIELLASKLVVSGVTSTTFAPGTNITRAEFASLLVRSLGLSEDTASAAFADVKSSDWFAGSVGAAVKAKLVAGFSDNSFKPNATITREQMAVMVANAISAAGKQAEPAANDVLDKFNDQASISSWAKAAVAKAVEANIITGMAGNTFEPSANANRAQAAVMLKRLLQYTSFIN